MSYPCCDWCRKHIKRQDERIEELTEARDRLLGENKRMAEVMMDMLDKEKKP